jgi:hypothetical protein
MKITLPIEVDIQEAYDTLSYKEQQEFMINNMSDIPNFNIIEEFFERDLLKDIDTEILLDTLKKQGITKITN